MKRRRKKSNRNILSGIIFMLIVLALAFCGTNLRTETLSQTHNSDTKAAPAINTSSELTVHFIDVGQGDSTLIQIGGHFMLIDAGDNSKGTALQLYLQKQGVEKLDYLILTHPDADHIGGADVIITKFEIGQILMPDYPADTRTYNDVLDAMKQKQMQYIIPAAGNTYMLGDACTAEDSADGTPSTEGSASFTILAPLASYDNANDSSIALLLTHGQNRFLFTGDCEETAEADIVNSGQDIHANVYQAGHHGSRTASSQLFMDAVAPEYAVISCGEDNSYGHPHAEVLNRFRSLGIKVFRTDEQGTVTATSDGTRITWNCAPSDTWKAGEPGGKK